MGGEDFRLSHPQRPRQRTPLVEALRGQTGEDFKSRRGRKLKIMEKDGGSVRASSFLRVLGERVGHPLRCLAASPSSPSRKKLWLAGPRLRRLPRVGVDWARRCGKRGGGAGPSGAKSLGPIFATESFLREVCFAYYKRRL